ncbi:RNA-guided endonuclease InsQ/TnpB family protein [Halococcus salsus]|uniref:RNA-guided endonuclease InsQ/TnpB family protein n=1 Tax=Halococcus salsus TaxID=2162894 RepID=UPI001356A0DD|nr:RNA-guided endonuclease TnpB family protein [Halococcus salsus]
MWYARRYRMFPTNAQSECMDEHRNIYRQAYNHFLYRLNHADGRTLMRDLRDELPELKKWWTDLKEVHSRALQRVAERLDNNLSRLAKMKEKGRKVGQLKWKAPSEYRSFTYSQSGFELKNTSGRTAVLRLSKIGEISIRYHRELSDDATIKEIHVKKERTGEWFASLVVDDGEPTPEPPKNPDECVGIDVGILKYVHDSDGFAVGSLDLSDERERLEREQRKLSRKEHGSANYKRQRRRVAECHADLKRKRRDFLHRLSNYYATEYDFVAMEDLNVAGMMQFKSNSRNRASAAWGTFLRMLEYKCEREGTHFVAVNPAGTTKECSRCGIKTEKPLWVREHSCPACGFEADRDENAAYNVLARGLKDVGVVHPERTPVETALPVSTASVDAKRVVEAGSPALKERTASAVSE